MSDLPTVQVNCVSKASIFLQENQKNQISEHSICYVQNQNILDQLDIYQAAWVILKYNNNVQLVYIMKNPNISEQNLDENVLYLSQEMMDTMSCKNMLNFQQQIVTIQRMDTRQFPIYPYVENSTDINQEQQNLRRLNYFPQLTIAKKIVLINIRNKNASLCSQPLIQKLICDTINDQSNAFICKPGDILKFSLSDSKLTQISSIGNTQKQHQQNQQLSLTYQQMKKLYKLTPSQSQQIQIQKYENMNSVRQGDDCLYFQVDAVFYFQQQKNATSSANEKQQLTYITKENISNLGANDLQNQFFIADIQGDTDIVLESFSINYPVKQSLSTIFQSKLDHEFFQNLIQNNSTYKEFINTMNNFMTQTYHNQKLQYTKPKHILLIGSKGMGKKLLLRYLASQNGLKYYQKDISKISSLKHLERARTKGINMRPTLIHFRNTKSLAQIIQKQGQSQQEEPGKVFHKSLEIFLQEFESQLEALNDNHQTIIVCSVDKFNEQDPADNTLKSLFHQTIFLNKPTEETEQEEILQRILRYYKGEKFFNEEKQLEQLEKTQRVCSGLPPFTLKKMVQQNHNDFSIFLKSIEKLKKSSDIEALSIPNVSWEDVGGLKSAKQQITQTLILPQQFPQLFNETFRPRTGLLFFGPPGTGKTLLAKCIATECNMNFLSVKGPELLNMYIGESEKNVRDIFAKARRNPPCVIFFDELDAIAPVRGNGSDSSQVMDRIVAQFLTEMDEISKIGKVFVIGATNRPDLLDQSLLRPGRFDKMVYLGITQDIDSRVQILQAQTRKLNLDQDVNLRELAEKIPNNFTGADLYGVTSQSVLQAVKRRVKEIDQKYKEYQDTQQQISINNDNKQDNIDDQHQIQEQAQEQQNKSYKNQQQQQQGGLSFNSFIEQLLKDDPDADKTTIKMTDFEEALKNITPSVSFEELQKYEQLKLKFQG